MKKILLTLFVFFVFSQAASADQKFSFPKQKNWVSDGAQVLSAKLEQKLTQDAKQHEKNTGNQFVIVTINSLNNVRLEDYSKALANEWKIGRAGENDGVLLLVSVKDRKIRIEVGRGLKNTLTNAISQRIIDEEIVPELKNGNFEQGIINGHRSIIEALGGRYEEMAWLDYLWLLLIFPFFWLGRLFGFDDFSGGGGVFDGDGASGDF